MSAEYKVRLKGELDATFKEALAKLEKLSSKTINLNVNTTSTNGVNKTTEAVKNLNKEVDKIGKKSSESSNLLNSSFSKIGGYLAGYIGISQGINYAKEIVTTTAQFESLATSIKFASDSSAQGEISLQWIKDMSKTYGIPILEATQGFKTFQGALMNTKFSASEVRTMFGQVSTAVSAMGLSGDDAKGVFLALGQVMSKGKVQAEELRGQIGERIPGAFSIAARAMGVTSAELDKLMKDGKLLAEDFLPKFAKELEKTFGEGQKLAIDNVTGSINRLGNSWTTLALNIGNSNKGIIKSTIDATTSLIDFVADYARGAEGLNQDEGARAALQKTSNFEKYYSNQSKLLQRNGMSKSDIEKDIKSDIEFKIAEINQRIKKADELEITLKEMQKKADYNGDGKATIQLAKQISNNQRNREANRLIAGSLTAIGDKEIDKLFKPNATTGKDGKDFDTNAKNKVRGVSSNTSHITINLEALQKDVKQSFANTTDGKMLQADLVKLLMHLVNDVNTAY